MSDLPADIDDAGIFAIVVLATVAVGAGLSSFDVTLWVLPLVFVAFMLLGEIAARRLAALKERQLVDGGDRS